MKYDSIAEFPFHYNIKTRWKDIDAFGHINNAVYLTYIEDARISFFNRWNLKDKHQSLIVASIKIDYLNQLKHPSQLIIGHKLSRIGNSSFDIQAVVFEKNAESPSAMSIVTCVCYNYVLNQTVAVYDAIKADYLG